MATNPFQVKPSYQVNSTQPKVAAATSVAPPTSFLGNVWNGISSGVGGFLNGLKNPTAPTGTSPLDTAFNAIGNTASDFASGKMKLANTPGYDSNGNPLTTAQSFPSTGKANPFTPNPNPYNIASPAKTTTLGDNTGTSSPGSYKGVAITPGTDAQIQAQMSAIDAQQSGQNNQNNNQSNQNNNQNQNNQNNGGNTGSTADQSNVISNLANTENPTTYQQVVNSLANFQNPQYTTAYQNLQDIQNQAAEAQAGTENVAGGAPITASDQAGQSGILSRLYQAKIANAQTAVTNALTAGGQQLTGLEYAQGSLQPQLGNYGQTYYNPLSAFGGTTGGQSSSQGGQGLDPQTQASQLADLVASGQLDYATATSQMGYAGQQGTSLLRNAILAKNPQFNFNLSASSATTQAQGQQIGTYAQSANAALDKLQSDFNNLSGAMKTSIPAMIGIEQWIGSALGNQQLSTYQTTLHDARAQLSGVLATAGGMSPTGAQDTANQYLPDNMTANQLASKIAAAKALVAQKVQAFQQSGVQSNTSSTSGFNW